MADLSQDAGRDEPADAPGGPGTCGRSSSATGTGRATDRDQVLGLGAETFLDLETDPLEGAGEVDVALDVIGGEILDRSARTVRAGGTLVSIAEPPRVWPDHGTAVFFVVEPDRARLADLAQRVRDGRLRAVPGRVVPLSEVPAAFAPEGRLRGKVVVGLVEG